MFIHTDTWAHVCKHSSQDHSSLHRGLSGPAWGLTVHYVSFQVKLNKEQDIPPCSRMSRTRASLWGLVTDSRGLLFSAGEGMGRRRAVEKVNYIGRAGKVSVLDALLRLPSRALWPRFESLRSELLTAFFPWSQWSTFSLFQWLTAIVSKPSRIFIMSHDSITNHKRRWRKRTFRFKLLCTVGLVF